MHVQMHRLTCPGRVLMRLRHPSGRIVHLSCAIARSESNLPGIIGQLDTYGAVRARLGVDALGVNLWLSPALPATPPVEGAARARLRAERAPRRLEVFTLSGAPYGKVAADLTPPWTE